MSVRTMAKVWELSRHGGTNLLMLLAIADFADDNGNAYPAVQTLAEKCRMKPRNAQVILGALRQSGELEVRPNEGPKGTNLYRITLASQGVQHSAPLQRNAPLHSSALGGAKECAKGVQHSAPEPSVNHQEPSESATDTKRRRIPHDWAPDAKLMDWARQSRPDLNLDQVVERFRDHWVAKGEARASWEASFRNWVRLERKGPEQRRSRHADFNLNDYGGQDAIPA